MWNDVLWGCGMVFCPDPFFLWTLQHFSIDNYSTHNKQTKSKMFFNKLKSLFVKFCCRIFIVVESDVVATAKVSY